MARNEDARLSADRLVAKLRSGWVITGPVIVVIAGVLQSVVAGKVVLTAALWSVLATAIFLAGYWAWQYVVVIPNAHLQKATELEKRVKALEASHDEFTARELRRRELVLALQGCAQGTKVGVRQITGPAAQQVARAKPEEASDVEREQVRIRWQQAQHSFDRAAELLREQGEEFGLAEKAARYEDYFEHKDKPPTTLDQIQLLLGELGLAVTGEAGVLQCQERRLPPLTSPE